MIRNFGLKTLIEKTNKRALGEYVFWGEILILGYREGDVFFKSYLQIQQLIMNLN